MGKCDIDVTQKKKGRFGQDSSFSLLRCVCQITGFLFFATLQKITPAGSSYTSILVVDRQIGNGVMDLMVSPSRFQSMYISLTLAGSVFHARSRSRTFAINVTCCDIELELLLTGKVYSYLKGSLNERTVSDLKVFGPNLEERVGATEKLCPDGDCFDLVRKLL